MNEIAPPCIIWNLDPTITLWSMNVRWYGLLFGLGIILGHTLLSWQIARAGYPENTDIRLTWALALGMLIGAFTGHRVFYAWDQVAANP
ncbi:MAG: prolipoprotein diacylglyceryl transferase, partial [Magnetococcales bacterium]|nr:prolipoprotein diacylglyceryl transferase [Magnetococcales bacterium]